MDNNLRNSEVTPMDFTTVTGQNKLLRSSFAWMGLAMALTTITSYVFGFLPGFTSFLVTETEFGPKPTVMAYVVMFAPLILVMIMNFGFNRLSCSALIALFVIQSIVFGMSLSFIFWIYEMGSIIKVFFSTTALFGIMAVAGYTTKTDLTKMGSILIIGLFGILIASLINVFMRSPGMDYLISIIGVIIFTGLTAYDVQKLKDLGQYADNSTATSKLGIMGALTLYFDFINLFLFLLRLFGGRKD
jgi:FtsH-binding integral membrane protein